MSSKQNKKKNIKEFKQLELNDEYTNLITFSFCDYKSLFDSLLLGPDRFEPVVEDKGDFWKFVTKYESMLRNAGQATLNKPLRAEQHVLEGSFHKRKLIPMHFSAKSKDGTSSKTGTDSSIMTNVRIKQFQEIILIYMDFKQKEKFAKIKNLRKTQKNLPISRFKKELCSALEQSRVLIVAGDTGCGKSTQVPQYMYEFGYRSIACTQPRRLACVSLSKRVAHEMLDDWGSKVGFQIRFEKSKTALTNIVFITEGLLLRQLAVENNLEQYDVLILDEIHERNLFGDFLLGVTKCLLRAKPNLKLILMSATINVELFHGYFKDEGAQLIEVPGRLYPIKTMFMPPPALELNSEKKQRSSATGRIDPAPFVQVLSLIDEKYPTTERGDVLIFVSGVNEITTLSEAIIEYSEKNAHWILLPLHSGLALKEQDKVFDYAPDGMRKCIVSTNIAETSLTVDGIRFVIDSGKVKEMSYDSSCKGQRLKEFWVSKSSAEQRKGRAGRTGPGNCFRIFSEKQYDAFEAYPTPEIFRVPLDTILLQMVAMGLPNVRNFPFIEAPTEESIEQTILALKQHNAFTFDEKITPLGRALSNLPVDISIGKMLLMGCVFPDVEKILTLAAAMSVQNPFTNRAFTDPKCEQERSALESDQGDIFILLRAYREWLLQKWNRENSRKWCHKLGIEEQRFYEIAKLRKQFQNVLESCNMTATQKDDEENLSSADRTRRHGEVRMLKAIKRKQKYQEPRKRKVLKKSGYNDDEDFTEDADDDIRDVDFRLNHDSAKMEILLNSAKTEQARDVLLLKLIIVSGFYPQIAIADEFNYCKGGTQQFFHTSLKPFISIHPNAYFAKNFDILKLNDSDVLEKPLYYTPKQLFSSAHQVLCYQNLLETAKPYLMNCIRMPAAQSLLLFSYTIDTNASITRIVCDSWLCLDFPTANTGCELLCRAITLRRTWTSLLSQKLDDIANSGEQFRSKERSSNNNKEKDLWQALIDFISLDISFTIKRLLPADIKKINNASNFYYGNGLKNNCRLKYYNQLLETKANIKCVITFCSKKCLFYVCVVKSLYTYENIEIFKKFTVNPFATDFALTRNEEKGGINVTENVVYGCLNETQWTSTMDAMLREHTWKCSHCNTDIELNTIEKLIHQKTCTLASKHRNYSEAANAKESVENNTRSDRKNRYYCRTCDKALHLTNIDILKHKKYCK